MATKSFSELKIIGIIFVVLLFVIASGILAYKSLTAIVSSASESAKPDVELVLLKGIFSELSDAENSVRSYSLSKDENYLSPYYQSVSIIDKKISSLYGLAGKNSLSFSLMDSITLLIEEKYALLNEMLTLHDETGITASLEKMSVKFSQPLAEEIKADTLTPKKKGNFFKRIFGKKEKVAEDTIKTEKKVGVAEIQTELAKAKTEQLKKLKVLKLNELELTQKNKELTDKLRSLIAAEEERQMQRISEQTKTLTEGTQETNRLIAVFCVVASFLLLLVCLVIISYIRKNTAYNIALNKAKSEAEELARTKEFFLANMSHEIRTPMNSIAGFTEQVLQTPLTDEQQKQLNIIKKSADHLLGILNDVLDYSKLQAGKLQLESNNFKPDEILKEIVMLMKPQAEKKSLKLFFQLENSFPEVLLGDELRLRQILLNLTSNAIKFTEKGEVKIHATSSAENANKVKLILRITDTGIGIEKNKLSKIFDEFEQADTSVSRKYGGTGLGLSITKKLVELQNGTIEIKSEVSKGSEVTVSIPYLIGSSVFESENGEQFTLNEKLKNKKILIVDDEEYNRALLATILKKWGIKYTETNDGNSALEELKRNDYDVILLDIRMSGISGTETTKLIRQNQNSAKANIPIIALTAATSESDILQYKSSGINEFLAKPFKEIELHEKLLTVLNLTDKKTFFVQKRNILRGENTDISEPSESYNLNDLYRLANGNEKFISEMLQTFIDSTEEGIAQIKKSTQEQQWDKVVHYAHKIAAPCLHLNTTELLKLLNEIEQKARSKNTVSISVLVNKLEEEATILLPKLKGEIKAKG